MNVDIENLTGRKVEYIGPGSKRGSIGIVEGVGVGPVIFVSFNGFANTRDNRLFLVGTQVVLHTFKALLRARVM